MQPRIQPKTLLLSAALLLFFILIVFLVNKYLPVNVEWSRNGPFSIGVDWKGIYHLAGQALLRGENPHYAGTAGLQNFAWVMLPLLPLTFLPPSLGAAFMFTFTFFAYAFIAIKLGIKWWGVVGLLLSPFVIGCANTGNIDAIVALGLVLPHPVGLFFLVLKPQLTLGVILYWLYLAWQRGKWKAVLQTFAPVALAILLELAIFGLWPLRAAKDRLADFANASTFPYGVFIGVGLLWYAFRHRNEKFAISSSPFLAPYLTMHGYGVALLGLEATPILIATIIFWVGLVWQNLPK